MQPQHLHILLVDDDEDDHIVTRDLLAECLADRFDLDWVASAEAGLVQLRGSTYDICLCDYRLGGMTGLEFIAEARRADHCPPIILMTGQGDLEVDLAAMKAGAEDYLAKNHLDARGLERAIRYALERQRSALALKRAYEQLKSSTETALLQERLAAVGQLAAGVAHEFNNILTVIQGYSSLLLAKTRPGDDNERALRHVLTSTERAARLVSQLLSFSRQQMLQPEPVDFNAVVDRVAHMLDQVIEEHVRLHLELAPELPLLTADRGMLEQIVLNLAINARDAMAGGGNLYIRTAKVEVGPGDLTRHPEARPGRFICLTVADTGCGMDAATRARLFEPFFTTKDVGKGTGMGLASVYGIVKQHQGWIEVESQLGHGSTFRIMLPAVVAAPVRDFAPALKPAGGGSGTILVAEDEPELQNLACEILRQYGFHVLAASSGPEAMEVWKRAGGRVDLLLTDMVMPGGMSGQELAAALTRCQPDLKVIYTSGYSVDFAGRSPDSGPISSFLAKPYSPRQLVQLIHECLEQKG